MNRLLQNLEFNPNSKRINYRDLMIFIMPVLIFSLYLYIYNPGILTYESVIQIHQIATGEFTNSFPFLHTLIEMIFLKTFGTPLSIAVLQIFVFSAIWTVICKYHRDDANKNSNTFLLQFIVTLIISLIPINAVYSITLWKEILFSYSLLFLTFLIKVLIDRSGELDLKFAIILALAIAVTSQLSTIGIYIGIITLIAILGYLFIKNKKRDKSFIILPILTIAFILLIGSLSFAFTVEDAQTSNNSGGAQIVWSVLRGDDWNGQAYYINKGGAHLQETQNKYYAGNNITPTADYEKLTSAHHGGDKFNQINSFVVYFKDHTLTDTLFYSPALYMYLAIILLIAIQLITKSKDMYLLYVPNLINIIGVFLTVSINENRFLYPNLLIFYLLVIIFISIYSKKDLKPLPVTLNTQKRKESNVQRAPNENVYRHDTSQDSFANIDKTPEPAEDFNFDEMDIDSILEEIELDMTEEPTPNQQENQEFTSNLTEKIELDKTEEPTPNQQEDREYNSDLIDEILKEMEMEKQNKD